MIKGFLNIFIVLFLFATQQVFGQTDTGINNSSMDTIVKNEGLILAANKQLKDTVIKPSHSPRKATMRSAIIPGWGQAYNKQYWKIPLVYAVIGIPAGTYFYNNSWYKKSKFAYETRIALDTASFPKIDPKLEVLSNESLRFYRNEFRRNRDYSILYTLVAWGLNVVDATVSGHLKEFDVSDDLSMRVNPIFSPGSNTKGVSLVFAFKSPAHRLLEVR